MSLNTRSTWPKVLVAFSNWGNEKKEAMSLKQATLPLQLFHAMLHALHTFEKYYFLYFRLINMHQCFRSRSLIVALDLVIILKFG